MAKQLVLLAVTLLVLGGVLAYTTPAAQPNRVSEDSLPSFRVAEGTVHQSKFSNSGLTTEKSLIVTAANGEEKTIWSIDTKEITKSARGFGNIKLSPSGKFISFSVQYYEGETGHLIRVSDEKEIDTKGALYDDGDVFWAPDESFVVIRSHFSAFEGTGFEGLLLVRTDDETFPVERFFNATKVDELTWGETGNIKIEGGRVTFTETLPGNKVNNHSYLLGKPASETSADETRVALETGWKVDKIWGGYTYEHPADVIHTDTTTRSGPFQRSTIPDSYITTGSTIRQKEVYFEKSTENATTCPLIDGKRPVFGDEYYDPKSVSIGASVFTKSEASDCGAGSCGRTIQYSMVKDTACYRATLRIVYGNPSTQFNAGPNDPVVADARRANDESFAQLDALLRKILGTVRLF